MAKYKHPASATVEPVSPKGKRIAPMMAMLWFLFSLFPKDAVSQVIKNDNNQYQVARRAYHSKAYQTALQAIDSCILLGNRSADVLNLRAKICLQLNDTTAALAHISEILQKKAPLYQQKDAHATAAMVRAKMGDTLKVLVHLTILSKYCKGFFLTTDEPLLAGYWDLPGFETVRDKRQQLLMQNVLNSLSFIWGEGELFQSDCLGKGASFSPDLYTQLPKGTLRAYKIRQVEIYKGKLGTDLNSFNEDGRFISQRSINEWGENLAEHIAAIEQSPDIFLCTLDGWDRISISTTLTNSS